MVWAEERGWVSKGMIDPAKLGNKTHDEMGETPDLGGGADLSPGAPEIAPA
jgi:hypothetical protein